MFSRVTLAGISVCVMVGCAGSSTSEAPQSTVPRPAASTSTVARQLETVAPSTAVSAPSTSIEVDGNVDESREGPTGRILVRDDTKLQLFDIGTDMVLAEIDLGDRFTVVDQSRLARRVLLEIGSNSLGDDPEMAVLDVDSWSILSLGRRTEPSESWQAPEPLGGATAVSTSSGFRLFDRATGQVSTVPGASWLDFGVRTHDGRWLVRPVDPSLPSFEFDPESEDRAGDTPGWATVSWLERVAGVELPALRDVDTPDTNWFGPELLTDGGLLVFRWHAGEYDAIVLDDGTITAVTNLGEIVDHRGTSNDGAVLVAARDGGELVDVRSGARTGPIEFQLGLDAIELARDGVLIGSGNGPAVVELEKQTVRRLDDGFVVDLSPDGTWLLVWDSEAFVVPRDDIDSRLLISDKRPLVWVD